MLRKAFTLIELVFVVVIVGILAAVVMPKLQQDELQEATDRLVKHIRYTQHLALSDDLYTIDDGLWFQNRWRIVFHQNAGNPDSYSILSDKSIGQNSNYALDPLTSLKIAGAASGALDNERLMETDLGTLYNIEIDMATCNYNGGSTTANQMAFDHTGRPHCVRTTEDADNPRNPMKYLASANITIELRDSDTDESRIITVEKETGYIRY